MARHPKPAPLSPPGLSMDSSFASLVKAGPHRANAFAPVAPAAPTPAATAAAAAASAHLSVIEEHDLASDAAHQILPCLQERFTHVGILDMCEAGDVARFIHQRVVVRKRSRFFTENA